MKKVYKAVIPAAGFGTRLLPATKSVPKEMLPIVDTPAIDYVVGECIASGITEICIIVSKEKDAILSYFDTNEELNNALKKANKTRELALVEKYKGKANFTFVTQKEMRGTAKAIELCKDFTGEDPFVVLFPDDVVYSDVPVAKQLISAYETTGSTIVGCQHRPKEICVYYGIMSPISTSGKYTLIDGFKEKPTIEEVNSTLTSLGRFLLTSDIYDYIDKAPVMDNGEVYLPSAIDIMAKSKKVYAYEFDGVRYDMGSKIGYLEANIEYTLRNANSREELIAYLEKLAKNGYNV